MDTSRSQSSEDDGSSDTSNSTVPSRVRYGQSAHRSQQPSVTNLIPKRRFTWAVLLTMGLSLIAAVEAGYGWVYVLNPNLPSWPMLNPQAPGSLASWLSSLLLLVGATSCLLTYLIRRHRIDDYRGGYRYWLWAAAAFVLGSINSSVAIHEILGEVFDFSAQLSGLGVWLLIGSVLLFLLAPEALNSRLTVVASLTSFLAYGFAVAVSLGMIWSPEQPLAILLGSSAAMCGHLGLVTATGLYVRFVYLDAHGLLPDVDAPRRERQEDDAQSKSASQDDCKAEVAESPSRNKTEGPLSRRNRNAKKQKQAKTDLDDSSTEDDHDRQTDRQSKPKQAAAKTSELGDEDEMKNLSKSERRRLRKLKRRRAA